MVNICTIENCCKRIHGRGWCKMHYERYRRRGDFDVGRTFRSINDVEDIKKILFSKRVITKNGCWEWIGARNKKGYGMLRVNQRPRLVHRLSCFIFHDLPIEDDLLACHKCDNPPCFNPKHLFLGTNAENIKDMYNKNRR